MLRKMYSGEGKEFDSVEEALKYLSSISTLGIERWVRTSKLIKSAGRQRTLWEFL